MCSSFKNKRVSVSIVHINHKFFGVMVEFANFIVPPDFLCRLSFCSGVSAASIGIFFFFQIILQKIILNFNKTKRFSVFFFILNVSVGCCKRNLNRFIHIKKFFAIVNFKTFARPALARRNFFIRKWRNTLNRWKSFVIRIVKLAVFIAIDFHKFFFAPAESSSSWIDKIILSCHIVSVQKGCFVAVCFENSCWSSVDELSSIIEPAI